MLAFSLIGDPLTAMLHLVVGALVHFADSGHTAIADLLNTYLFQTVDATTPGHGPLTANPSLAHLNLGVALIADVLVGGVMVVMFLRFMFDHSLRSHYRFREVMPRLLTALVLMHFSLPLMQLLIDLNNGIGAAALQLDGGLLGHLPWDHALDSATLMQLTDGQDIFLGLFACGLVVALVILALAQVIRYALLGVLVVTAPLAALGLVLTDTRGHSRAWGRLFTATLFMQAVQLIVLRVAVAVDFGNGNVLAQTLYSLATLWLMLKVPGAMNTASHLETKAKTYGHDLFKAAHKAIAPHHSAHSAAAH